MSDALAQNFAPNQNNLQPGPYTIAAAATIAPVQLNTYVTGTTQVATITPYLSGQHILLLTFTDGSPGTTLTTGNILNAVVPTQNIPCMFYYNPITAKYIGWANNLT